MMSVSFFTFASDLGTIA